MKLLSLQIVGAGPISWSSQRLIFGPRATQLYGPNGCGKTPIVQAIVFALGYKVEFRDDIRERCDHVALEVLVGDNNLRIKRYLSKGFYVTVERKDCERVELTSDREYSRLLLSLWGLEDPTLTTIGNDSTYMYSGLVLPLFYLDQDHGYADPYYSANRFIKDQYAESMRLIFGLSPKNPYDRRRVKNELNERLEYLDRGVVRLERAVEQLASDIGGMRRPIPDIDRDLVYSMARLEALRESGDVPEQIGADIDVRIADLQQQEMTLLREQAEIESRIRGFTQIRQEIEVEAQTLSLNEEAQRVFGLFDAICANEDCGLFVRSSVSYGKSLLYLKDQTKDLERTKSSHENRLAILGVQTQSVRSQIASMRAEREALMSQSSVSSLVDAVSELTTKVIQLQRARNIEEELARIETEYVSKLNERERVQTRLADLEGGRGASDVELIRIRAALAARIQHWIAVLRTSNVGHELHVDADFNVTFDGQKVSKFKGSTLTRIILAIRTATFDVVTSMRADVPRFFILDTPRQQDISREDLAHFIRALQNLASERSAQIVFSTTNHRYELDDQDVEWVPSFPGDDHPMFLGIPLSNDEQLPSRHTTAP